MKKTIALISLFSVLLSLLCSCSFVQVFNSDTVKASYTDDEYHFKMTFPSTFSGPDMKYLDEDENEVEYRTVNGEDLILLTCLFNTEKNFYDYINKAGFEKQYISFKNAHSFIYDKTQTDKPEYKIVMATKKMIYTLNYTSPDMRSEEYLSNLEFIDINFTEYANVPADNATLSAPVSLSEAAMTVKIPADCEYVYTPRMEQIPYKTVEVEVEENGETVKKEEQIIDTDKYTGIFISNSEYICAFSSPKGESVPYSKEQINKESAAVMNTDRATEMLSGTVTELEMNGKGDCRTNDGKNYLIFTFTCKVNGERYDGTYSVGYTESGNCFEYTYVKGDLTDGEESQFMDVIKSVVYK